MHGKSFNRKKKQKKKQLKREMCNWKLVCEEYRVNIKFSFTFIYVFFGLRGLKTTHSLKFCRGFYIQFLF